MQTNLIFLKKAAYICSLIALFFSNSKSYSQIIYTDIPDASPNATYPLDLNNDTVVDFLIQFDLVDKVMCKPLDNNAYSGFFGGGVHLPWALSASADICDSLITWYDIGNPGTMAWGTNIGNWVGVTDQYLALKLIVGTNTYFGWARLDLSATSTSFTIKDYAYESSTNTCIQAGQTVSGGRDILNECNFSISPNPLVSSTIIQTTRSLNNASLKIYSSCGQTLKQENNISGQRITLYRDALKSGLYYIGIMEENKNIAVKKLIITD